MSPSKFKFWKKPSSKLKSQGHTDTPAGNQLGGVDQIRTTSLLDPDDGRSAVNTTGADASDSTGSQHTSASTSDSGSQHMSTSASDTGFLSASMDSAWWNPAAAIPLSWPALEQDQRSHISFVEDDCDKQWVLP